MKYKQLLLKLHFGFLLFLFINFIVSQLTDISISSFLIFLFKICIYISGLILLFLTIRPFEKKAIYFSIYLLSPLGILFSWLAGGIFGAIIGSLLMWTITVDDFVAKKDNYKITKQFTGFISPCCKYNLKKNYFYLVEKKIGDISIEGPRMTSVIFTVNEQENTLNLQYQFEDIKNNIQIADTIIVLN